MRERKRETARVPVNGKEGERDTHTQLKETEQKVSSVERGCVEMNETARPFLFILTTLPSLCLLAFKTSHEHGLQKGVYKCHSPTDPNTTRALSKDL